MRAEEGTELLRRMLLKTLEYVRPENLLRGRVSYDGRRLSVLGESLDLDEFRHVFVVGGGKATGKMAEFLEGLLGDRIDGGVISVLSGTEDAFRLERVEVIGASHPLPDERSVRAAKRILDVAKRAGKGDLLIALISGGGSSLMCRPDGVSLEDFVETTRQLMLLGADIFELNTVRKHLSAIKGGRLAEAAYPASVLSLIISDVVGDRVDVIASGPTAPDPTTYRDALRVLRKYGLERFPERVVRRIEDGAAGRLKETPKPGSPIFDRVRNIIVGRNRDACEKLRELAESEGLRAVIVTTFLTGEAKDAGRFVASIAREVAEYCSPFEPPVLLIFGGETTVTVRGSGIGGRNQEFCLSAALELGVAGVDAVVASVGTDGIDGNSPAAGGIMESKTALRLKDEIEDYLRNNDSYTLLSKYGLSLVTGPTLTNVNDVAAVLVLRGECPSRSLAEGV